MIELIEWLVLVVAVVILLLLLLLSEDRCHNTKAPMLLIASVEEKEEKEVLDLELLLVDALFFCSVDNGFLYTLGSPHISFSSFGRLMTCLLHGIFLRGGGLYPTAADLLMPCLPGAPHVVG